MAGFNYFLIISTILIISIISIPVDPGSTAPGTTDFNCFNYFVAR